MAEKPSNSNEKATSGEESALEEAFRKFAVHGDTRATGKEMHGKNWSKLCKDCHIIDGKNVTTTDVDIVFSKIKYVYPYYFIRNFIVSSHSLPSSPPPVL